MLGALDPDDPKDTFMFLTPSHRRFSPTFDL
jgi:hypothetical protein